MSRSILALLVVGIAAVAAGCGGGQTEQERIASISREVEEKTAKLGPIGPGLGERDPPPALASGWRTDFSRHTVPLSQFQSGGPGKDGIPAIDRPRFASVARTAYLKPQEPVVELAAGEDVRAYPIQILIWHEIVNDRVGSVPVAVTFCPLCNTAVVFDRRLDGRVLSFGTTGNLRNSDLVMYDRQTESWWQQFGGAGVVGRYAGWKLRKLPARIVSWADFRRAHPRGRVLTRATGHSRQYGQNPYYGYDDVDSPPFFAVANAGDGRLPPKERVVYIERAGKAVAVPFSALAKKKRMLVEIAGHRLQVRVLSDASSPLNDDMIADGRRIITVEVRENGKLVPFDQPFWFAVAAFRPDVLIVGR